MKAKSIIITTILVILAIISVVCAGLTLYGVDIVEETKSLLNITTNAQSVSFKTKEITLGVGQESSLDVVLSPKDAKNTYKLSSTDSSIVKVTGNKVMALKKGDCSIKVTTDNNLTNYADITVVSAPKKISAPKKVVMANGESYTFSENTPSDFYTYNIDNKNVATIDKTGTIKAISKGNATITITSYNGIEKKVKLQIFNEPTSFKLNLANTTMGVGGSINIVPEFNKNEGTSSYTFTTDNDHIVSVDNKGLVKALREGEANVTCTLYNNLSATCKIIVTEQKAKIRKNLDRTKPMVALTFDDGPDASNTEQILKSLKSVNGRATFFLVGSRIEGEEDIVQQEFNAGHEIGNHSWDHQYASNISEKKQRAEMNKTNDAIKKVIGEYPTVFRCPGGITSNVYETENISPIILWSIDTLDWSTKSSQATFNAIKSVFKKGQNLDGDIVLMHDIQDSTPKAVANIVKYLDKKGYQLVTVSELAYYRNTTMKNGETYSCFYPTTNYSQKRNNSNTNSNQTEFSTNQSNNSNNTTSTTVANNQNVVTDNTTPTVD
jgi:peptidoglycan/xylan/chitin deacetylase (PgdA/CDA1 family)